MNFYVLAYAHYEDYVPFFLTGPDMTEDSFNELCSSLIEQAGTNAVKSINGDSYIGWQEVVELIIPLLEEKGFIHIIPKKCEIFGSGIIQENKNGRNEDNNRLGSSLVAIIAHNEKTENIVYEDSCNIG